MEDSDLRFDQDYEEAVRLRDGTKATLRLIRPSDKRLLLEGFQRLSPQSRYARFLSSKQTLTDDELRYLTEVDGIDHFALAAVTRPLLGEEQGIGVGRFVRSKTEPDTAEPAITVADDQQGKGLGTVLLNRLADAAWERGVRRFRCEVLAENTKLWELLPEVGSEIVIQRVEGGTAVVTFVLEPPPTERPGRLPLVVRRMLSYFARELMSYIPRGTRPVDEAHGSEKGRADH